MNPNPFGSSIDTSLEQGGDRLGGFTVFDSDAYNAKIALAYAGESSGGAKSMTFHFQLEDGREYRETVYVTSGREKGQKNYYEKDGKKNPLPGYTLANDIALCATGKDLLNQTFEERVVKLYNKDAGAEVPTKVQVATSLLGQPVTLAIMKEVVDKNVDNGAGQYVPSGETREQNVIDKAFHTESRRTVSEATGGQPAGFLDKWVEKNKGQVRNKAKGAGGNAGAPGQASRPAPTAGAPAGGGQTKTLFGGG